MSMCGLHFLWPTPLADILQFLSVSILLHNFAQDYYCLEFMPNNFKFNSAVWHRFPMGLKDIVAQDEGTNIFFFPSAKGWDKLKMFPVYGPGQDGLSCPATGRAWLSHFPSHWAAELVNSSKVRSICCPSSKKQCCSSKKPPVLRWQLADTY